MSVNGIVSKIVVTAIVAQVLAGCGGAGPAGGLPAPAPAILTAMRASWVDPRAKGSPLLYVSDQLNRSVFIYAYPALTPMGELTGFNLPWGLCVNRRNGNVWVTDTFNNDLVEFPHGGSTPIRTLHQYLYDVDACAVNPKTGDVAAVNDGSEDPAEVIIFKPSHAPPKQYSDIKNALALEFAAYDPDGNLFVDDPGFGRGRSVLEELAKGSQRLLKIPWHGPPIGYPGGVQFDGTDLAIGDSDNHVVYRTSNGTVVATVTLKDACQVRQFFIHYGFLIAPNACKSYGNVLIYRYPAGGEPVKQVRGLGAPVGAVVSP
jgi:hypothetical protein